MFNLIHLLRNGSCVTLTVAEILVLFGENRIKDIFNKNDNSTNCFWNSNRIIAAIAFFNFS